MCVGGEAEGTGFVFAGFLPTPARPGPHPRLFALAFAGSETTDANTFVFDGHADIVHGFASLGYRTLCIGGVGFFILQGIPLRRFDQVLGASIVVVVLALVLDGLFALLQRFVVPRGVTARARPARKTRTRPAPAITAP